MATVNTPYFQQLLRKVFRLTEAPSFELPESISPVYNLSPQDIYFINGQYSDSATLSLGTFPVPTKCTQSTRVAGLSAADVTIVDSILAGTIFRVRISTSGHIGATAANNHFARLMNASGAAALLHVGYIHTGLTRAAEITWDTGWLIAGENMILKYKFDQDAASYVSEVTEVWVIPS